MPMVINPYAVAVSNDVTPTLSSAWPSVEPYDDVGGYAYAGGGTRTISDINQTITLKLSAPTTNPNFAVNIYVRVNGGSDTLLAAHAGSGSWTYYSNTREFTVTNNQTVEFVADGTWNATPRNWSNTFTVTNVSDGGASVGSSFAINVTAGVT